MDFFVEDGSGFTGANSYITTEFIDDYAEQRNLPSWAAGSYSADQKKAAAIAATDYIENRFGARFMGQKLVASQTAAKANLKILLQAGSLDTITIGAETFTVVSGDDLLDTLNNIMDDINLNSPNLIAEVGPGLSIIVKTVKDGPEGDSIGVSTSSSNFAWLNTTMIGGNFEGEPQTLSFPRAYIYTKEGFAINGVPKKVKQGCAEYAIRAIRSALVSDPIIGTGGQLIDRVRKKVGPLETEFYYVTGVAFEFKSYPAADALFKEFLGIGSGGVYR